MRRIIIILTSLLVACAAVSCSTESKTLTIVHVNDTHSHCDPEATGHGGVIERAAIIDSVRNADGAANVLFLHAGDFSQGTSYFTVLHGDIEVDLINALGYDVITLGNHEFDNGLEELGRRLSSVKCPVVCANYDFSPFEAGKYITPTTTVEKAGLKIGVVGMLCDISTVVAKETSDRIPRLGQDADIINKWAKELREDEHCDMVIVLSHMGYFEDMDICSKIHGVDLIVGGHSHTFLEEMSETTDMDGRRICVVQDGCWGQEVGLIKVQ